MNAVWWYLAMLAGILVFLIWLSIQREKGYVGPWEQHAVCRCGWWTRAPFGNLFHVHREVCPSCGEPKYHSMKVVTRRWNKGQWETKR